MERAAVALLVETIRLNEDHNSVGSILLANSNLPGPRGNLELAAAFADLMADIGQKSPWWNSLLEWGSLPSGDTSNGPAAEFLPFCALQSMGALYPSLDEKKRGVAQEAFSRSAVDSRWRVREGVAIGLQRVGEESFDELRLILGPWLQSQSFFHHRAVMAALAHPPILAAPENVRYCLEAADVVLHSLLSSPRSRDGRRAFDALVKVMEYAPSVFVAHMPGEGFRLLGEWASYPDRLAQRIVRANLGKVRLSKWYPEATRQLVSQLERS